MALRIETTPILSDDDSARINLLYRRYRDSIRRYVTRTFGAGPPDPDDVVHAAFERFALLGDQAPTANPRAFLMRSAHNYVIDQQRRHAVRLRYSKSMQDGGEGADDLDAERVLLAKERLEILDRTIRAMDRRHQEVLILNRIHGLNCAEIARRKNYSATMVKRLLAQALLACERALREADGDD